MWSKIRAASALESYADESGTDDGHPYSSFAGYVGDESKWKVFSKQWLDVLAELKLGTEFHASQFYARAGREHWSESEVISHIEPLAKVIKAHTFAGFAVLVSNADYESNLSAYVRRYRLRHRYYLLFEKALLLQRNLTFVYKGTLACFFDNKPKFEGRAAAIFDGFVKQFDLGRKFVSRRYLDSAVFPPIQAADFLAYELRLYGMRGGTKNPHTRPAMNALKRDIITYQFKPAVLREISERLDRQRRT